MDFNLHISCKYAIPIFKSENQSVLFELRKNITEHVSLSALCTKPF